MVVVSVNLVHVLVVVLFDLVHSFIFLLLVLVATLLVLMAVPVLQTYPAEFMAAPAPVLGAGHVVAALVLLDVLVADGALLCVDDDPVHVLGLGVVFDQPLLARLAVRGQVVLVVADLTLLLVAHARDHQLLRDGLLLTLHLAHRPAVRGALPLLAGFHLILLDELQLLVEFSRGEVGLPLGVGDFDLTVGVGGTPAVDAVKCAGFEFILQITNHALFAHHVPTLEVVRAGLRECVEADCALVRIQVADHLLVLQPRRDQQLVLVLELLVLEQVQVPLVDGQQSECLVRIDVQSVFHLVHLFVHFAFNLRVFDNDVIISVF